jgi:hypothetical protein
MVAYFLASAVQYKRRGLRRADWALGPWRSKGTGEANGTLRLMGRGESSFAGETLPGCFWLVKLLVVICEWLVVS